MALPTFAGIDTLTSEIQGAWNSALAATPTLAVRALALLLLALVLYGVYRLAAWVARRATSRLPGGAQWFRLLDVALRLTALTLFAMAFFASFPAGVELVGPALRAYVVVLLLFFGWALLRRLLARSIAKYGLDASLELLALNVALAVWFAVGLYLVFFQFGINLLPVLGGLGIAGIAIGFAAQDLLTNLIAGVTLLLDRPFTIGDWIRVNEWEGQVTRLTLRTTRIRTRDNELISIPNSSIAGNDIVNLSAGGPLRIRSTVGISYASDPQRAREAIMREVTAMPDILDTPAARVSVVELGDSSVNLDIIYWIDPTLIERRPGIQQRVLEATKRALDEVGVEIPFPQLQLHVDSAKGLRGLTQELATTLRERGT